MVALYKVPKLSDFSPQALDRHVAELLAAVEAEAAAVKTSDTRKAFRDRWLARKGGILTQVNEWLRSAPKDIKPEVGRRVNQLKLEVEKRVEFKAQQVGKAAPESSIDISLPGIRRPIGAEHPITRTMEEIVQVFARLGYSLVEGPIVESDYYNFEALNFPLDHPARDTQDTLFLANQEGKPARERLLLRTHTSPVQIRTMEKVGPPLRILAAGKVHRNDPPDASHSPMFHQIEGLAVDSDITFGDLKGTLDHAMKALFGSQVKTSFRPSFFPFTEPSAEMFVSCFICGGTGRRGEEPCRPCKRTGWIEILGCGMVDPNVFEFVKQRGYDPEKISAFAFGMGVDRIAMLKFGLDDLQLFFQGDLRFLEQFK
ncbi:MAG: phenylalanine--tRNA ligase subunit alpha [Acidobacteria bacterium]|nr:phenylalanine--tRNA ligase subunit alpha [Acidobacteriota bacterium]